METQEQNSKSSKNTDIKASYEQVLCLNRGLVPIAAACREVGISRDDFYNYRRKVNKNGGTAETMAATEQPTETADGGSLPQGGKTGTIK